MLAEGEDENTMTNHSPRLQKEARITREEIIREKREEINTNGFNICRPKEDDCQGSC